MINTKKFNAIGLMSGTSADGVDIALIKTNGKEQIKMETSDYYPFTNSFSKKIKSIFKKKINFNEYKRKKRIIEIEDEFTLMNYSIIKKFLKKKKVNINKIDVIGFHGQTISHNPDNGYSLQIGNVQKLSNLLNKKVVGNFRSNDISKGGQGAPLTPIFHFYLTKKIKKNICFINLGGISNLTNFNHKLKKSLNKIIAFDVGPCCSLIDDWISLKLKKKYDNKGLVAKKGECNIKIFNKYMNNPFFFIHPPKSLDRKFFSLSIMKKLNVNDGAATLVNIICESLYNALKHLPTYPDLCIISGGGRLNKFLIVILKKKFSKINVCLTEKYNWDGDAIEAYAFAYLSVRKLLNLPITFPGTTGINKSSTGGVIFHPF